MACQSPAQTEVDQFAPLRALVLGLEVPKVRCMARNDAGKVTVFRVIVRSKAPPATERIPNPSRHHVPSDFNLLDFVDFPAAFGAPMLLEGEEWWTDVPFIPGNLVRMLLKNIDLVPVYLGSRKTHETFFQITIGHDVAS